MTRKTDCGLEPQLFTGAGKAEILYTEEMFPTEGENYVGIHDLPMLQVLFLKCGECAAIISVDVVILKIQDQMKKVASEILEIPEENILLQATHVLSTPHFEVHHTLLVQAHINALREACTQAKRSLQPVAFGIDVAYAPVNVNRVVKTPDGWIQGVNLDGPVNSDVPVLRFDNAEGKPIAILYNCNVAPGCMEFSERTEGGRLVSGDLAGNSERFVDKMFENSVAVYTTGFTGDMWQALRARLDYMDRHGRQVVKDLHEAGFALMETLSVRLGEQVAKTAESIRTAGLSKEIHLYHYDFHYDRQEAKIRILTIEDTAIVSCGVEVCYETFRKIQEQSPFRHTFLLEFTEEGGGYLPEEEFFEYGSYQAGKCHYTRGTAEKFCKDIIESLKKSYSLHMQTRVL